MQGTVKFMVDSTAELIDTTEVPKYYIVTGHIKDLKNIILSHHSVKNGHVFMYLKLNKDSFHDVVYDMESLDNYKGLDLIYFVHPIPL